MKKLSFATVFGGIIATIIGGSLFIVFVEPLIRPISPLILQKSHFFLKNALTRPLGIFSAILVMLSLIGFLFSRKEPLKFKACAGTLLIFSFIAFVFAGITQENTQVALELKKGLETWERETGVLKEEIKHKDVKITRLEKEKNNLNTEVKKLGEDDKTYRGIIQKKENEIVRVKKEASRRNADLKNQLKKSLSERDQLNNQLSLYKKKMFSLQTEISDLEKISQPPPIDYEFSNNKLFLIAGDEKTQLFAEQKITDFCRSKSKKKAAIIVRMRGNRYRVIIFNTDRNLSDLSDWNISAGGSSLTIKNLKWVSDNVLRLYLSGYYNIEIDNIKVPKTKGIFEITIDEFNTLVKIERFQKDRTSKTLGPR
jgi:uncharacterized protein (UPF0335 family)